MSVNCRRLYHGHPAGLFRSDFRAHHFASTFKDGGWLQRTKQPPGQITLESHQNTTSTLMRSLNPGGTPRVTSPFLHHRSICPAEQFGNITP